MATFPTSLAKEPPVPSSASPLDTIRRARDGICAVYRQTPGWFTSNAGLTHPIIRDAISAMDNLCSDKPLPPRAVVPYTGGQCQTTYDVTILATNPSTGATSTFVRRRSGRIGIIRCVFLAKELPPQTTSIYEWSLTYGITDANPRGIEEPITQISERVGKYSIVSVVRVDGLPDNCGSPIAIDPPAVIAPNFTVNVDLPDIRVSPNVLVVVPVAIFKPEFVFSPNLSATFNMPINVGGVRFNFDGDNFVKQVQQNIDFSAVNTSITNSQTSINNNTNTSVSNSQTNINNNTNAQRNSLQNTINTSITNSQTSINNNTNTSVSNSQTSINSSTNTSITNSQNAIIAATNNNSATILARINALGLVVGLINTDLSLALGLLAEISLKPDCLEAPEPPSALDESPQPPEETNRNKPRLQAVVIQLTKPPTKQQSGGSTGAPTKQIAGWFAWKVEGEAFTTPAPINYERSVFFKPPHPITGYSYTLTNFAKGFAIEYSLPIG